MLPFSFFVIFSALVSGNSRTLAEQECFVNVKNGQILGKVMGTSNPQQKVCAYTSIPYATPPIGNLRFKAPEPPQPWGFLNATSLPNWRPQKATPPPGVVMSENCLFLNVYQPKVTDQENGLPVMIWIHGGGFTSGNSKLYGPSKLLSKGDVVLVVIHYRIGFLGFASTLDENMRGNFGLKDQSFAIRFVKENIKAFGGNPDKITIFGESAGGSSVMYQLISPLNKGLIQGVISQSGTALASWALDKTPVETVKVIAKRLGCSIASSTVIVSCLRKIEWQKILDQQTKLNAQKDLKDPSKGFIAFAPVIEPNLPGAFITAHPEEIMKSGNVPNIPVMIGATKHDGSFLLGTLYATFLGPHKLDQNPTYLREQIVPDLMKLFATSEARGNGATAASVEMTYMNGANRTSWKEIMPGLVDLVTVYAFKSSVQRSADILSSRNNKVYVYSFEHHSNNTLWSIFFGPAANLMPIGHGITHGDELIYLFDLSPKMSKEDKQLADIFSDMWLNFAKTGNPTPSQSNSYDDWIPYNTLDEPYMKLNITPKILHGYRNSWRPNGFEWN